MTAGQGAVLALDSIGKQFGRFSALSQVSLELNAGEVLCLLGENGAGKSTLVSVIAGILRPDAGAIRIDGSVVQIDGPRDAYALGIRLAPQELTLCGELSVEENVSLGHLPSGSWGLIDRKEMRRIAQERLRTLGLEHLDPAAQVEALPVVDKAFVQIARAMTTGARVLIADEPTAPMSGAEADRLLALMRSVTGLGTAVIFVSHRLDEVYRLGDRVVVLRDGRKVADEAVANLSRADLVRAMVGSRELATSTQGKAATVDRSDAFFRVRDLTSGELKGVGFEVDAREMVAVYGIAGSGRDQLGPALFGAAARSRGTITIGGTVLGKASARASIAAGMGYLPSERRSQGLVLEMSIRDNLVLAISSRLARRGFIDRKRERLLADEWVERLHLAARSTDEPVGTLSGGTQQKVLLARWLIMQPPLMILDEPTRGVDIATKAEIYQMLADIAADGCAVLVISSDIEEVSRIGTRVLVLSGGHLVASLGPSSQDEIIAGTLSNPAEIASGVEVDHDQRA